MGEPRSYGARSAALGMLLTLVIGCGVLAVERRSRTSGEDVRAGPPLDAPLATLARSAPRRVS